MDEAQRWLWAVSIIAQSAVLLRLVLLSWRRYGFFILFLVAHIVRSFVLRFSFPNVSTAQYAEFWFKTEPVLLFFQVMAVAESYRLTVAPYPRGLGRFGWWSLVGILACTGMIVLAFSGLPGPSSGWHRWHWGVMFARWTIVCGLAVFLLLSTFYFWALLPAHARSNTVTHRWLLTGYLLTWAVGQLAPLAVGKQFIPQANLLVLTGVSACYLGWVVLMTKSGEVAPPVPNPEQVAAADRRAQEILGQADAILSRRTPGGGQ